MFGVLSISDLARATTVCRVWRNILAGVGSTPAWTERIWKAAFAHRWPMALARTAGMIRTRSTRGGAALTWRQRCVARGRTDENWRGGSCRQTPNLFTDDVVQCLDGDRVVISPYGVGMRVVQLWPTFQEIAKLPIIHSRPCALVGPALTTISARGNELKTWRIEDTRCMRIIRPEAGVGPFINVVADPLRVPTVWTCTRTGFLQIDLETGLRVSSFGNGWYANKIAVDGHILASGFNDAQEVWDTRSATLVQRRLVSAQQCNHLSVDGERVMFASKWSDCHLWDLRFDSSQPVRRFNDTIWGAVAGGRVAVMTTEYLGNHRLDIYDRRGFGAPRATIPVLGPGRPIYMCMDTERIVSSRIVLDFV